MTVLPVRVGIVGAGANTRARHIPGFRAIDGVEILGVVNSSPESTKRVAREFNIPRTYDNWQAIVVDPDIDAVMIGTWPNLHCKVTCAALDAGKHVLTEARMARNATEAHRMLQASKQHADRVTQIVPSPFGLEQNDFLRTLLDDGFLGELRELVAIAATDSFWDTSQPLHWRQEADISGMNVLTLGIIHEAVLRYAPVPTRVFAQMHIFEPSREPSLRSGETAVSVPDSVQVLTELDGGGRGIYHVGGLNLFGPGHQIHLYGSRGTVRFELGPKPKLMLGRAGDAELQEAKVPPEQRGGWRVEAEFIGAIRGEETVRLTDFVTGVKYMEFTEAVSRSAAENRTVDLPLAEVS